MDSNDKYPILDTEQARTKHQQAKSSDISSSQDNSTEQAVLNKKTEGKVVMADSSLVNVAEPSSATDNERDLDAMSSADSLQSNVSTKGNEAPCLGKEVETSSVSSSPHTILENICDDSKGEKQARENIVSSQPPLTSAEVVESEGNEAKQNVAASPKTVPSICVILLEEAGGKEVEQCIAPDSSPSVGVEKMVGSLGDPAEGKIGTEDGTQTATTSDSLESKASSLKYLACEEIVPPEGKPACPTEETDVKNKEDAFPLTTSLEASVLTAESGDISGSENRETQTEEAALPTTEESEAEKNLEENERKAFFYISSCSVPGMGEGSEWPSVSAGYQMPRERPGRRIATKSQEDRRCLGNQRCHYVVVAIALLTAVIGCVTYHLSNSGIFPEVLAPIGASTAFLSVALCVFSAVYINYLSDLPQLPIMPNYELLGDVDSVMAMNRTSNPEFYFTEDGRCVSRTADSDYHFRQTQSADVIDKRGYGRRSTESLQTEVKRCSQEAGTGTQYSAQPSKEFKAESAVAMGNGSELSRDTSAGGMTACNSQDKVETSDGTFQHSLYASNDLPPGSEISDREHESDTRPLLPEKDR